MTISQITSEEAAEVNGVKISFKIHKGEAACGGWYPLRARKPTDSLMYLLREARAALRLVGLASEDDTTDRKPHRGCDEAGWETGHLRAYNRLMQSLADGRFYARGSTDTSKWTLPREPPQGYHQAGWESKHLLTYNRLMQSLADGRFYARGHQAASKWTLPAAPHLLSLVFARQPQHTGTLSATQTSRFRLRLVRTLLSPEIQYQCRH